jgi:hypothetical protein
LEHKELLIKYYQGLVNSLFKLLPLYEGRKYRTSGIVYSQDEAYKNYQIYLSNLLIEIYGNSQSFFQSENSIKLVSILRGMVQEIKIDEQPKVKRLTMECINICKKIIVELEGDED